VSELVPEAIGGHVSITSTAAVDNYTSAIQNLPQEAFLGSLLFFSISNADVNLANARRDLTALGLSTETLRKNLRPFDAFRKSSKRFEKKFKEHNGIRSEIMVRPVGEDGEQAFRHLVLERADVQAGKKRRVFYEKVGEITFTRGYKKDGEYHEHGVECRRTTAHLGDALTADEDQWLTEQLATFQDNYDHLLHYMDSHAVRTFVREYIYALSGTCVKESGGLYFIKQDHADEVEKLAEWVRSVGSEFHTLPLLNLAEQKDMILEAFEEETIQEVERLMGEVGKILSDPDRKIEEKTFDAYADKAAALAAKVQEYNSMLGARAERAAYEINIYGQQVLSMAGRIRESKTTQIKTVTTTV
jgi:hypothetical protein